MKNEFRSHTCGELRSSDIGKEVVISGWIDTIRDHGGLIFIDLRDHYGITQCTFPGDVSIYHGDNKITTPLEDKEKFLSNVPLESVITVQGRVKARPPKTENKNLTTGEIEIIIDKVYVLTFAEPLPMQVNSDAPVGEEIRLKYRFLDLRREKMQRNITLRSDVIQSLRIRMWQQGFKEFQTPILTSSSPEGARDFLVPSRMHPGKFYALPQAPQQFKQLLMVAGFDKYFQIAPCFRDEGGRTDRSPGEFYQLDFEMSFVNEEDVWKTIEPIIIGVFKEFCDPGTEIVEQVPTISYRKAMEYYGTDKPDLRNPLSITDVTRIFMLEGATLEPFKDIIRAGGSVKAIAVPAPRRGSAFYKQMDSWAKEQGMPGMGALIVENLERKGPMAKFINEPAWSELFKAMPHVTTGSLEFSVFFMCDVDIVKLTKFAAIARMRIAEELQLIHKNMFWFCWVYDFPMYEYDEELKKIVFTHNPFSMPDGGMKALNEQHPLSINARQYDLVCNGIELCSGGIRNHEPETLYKAFEIAGYTREEVDAKFGGMINAMKYGAPPHGGAAPGIDRIVMMIANEPNIREVIAFPLNQQGEDLLMQAPNTVDEMRLKELYIKSTFIDKKHKPDPAISAENDLTYFNSLPMINRGLPPEYVSKDVKKEPKK